MGGVSAMAENGQPRFTVLVVEDEELGARLLVRYLESMGCQAVVARNGMTALSLVAAGGIDAVLLDLHLPDIDGFEVLRRMNKDDSLAGLPVVITSARDDRDAIIQAMELIQAETQRAMIESLGAACHHIGQPATVIGTYLTMMSKRETDAQLSAMIAECRVAMDKISDVLERMRNVTEFHSEPYRPTVGSGPPRTDEHILDLNS